MMLKCKYCGDEIGLERLVKAKAGKKELLFCSWRCLLKWLVEVFNTGRQYEEGLEVGKPTK